MCPGKLVQSFWKSVTLEDQCAGKPLDRVYTDLVHPLRHLSVVKERYFVTFIDSYSGLSLDTFLHLRSEAEETALQIVHEVENVFKSRMKRLTTTNRNMVRWVCLD